LHQYIPALPPTLYTVGLPPSYYYKVFVFTGLKITHTCTQDTQLHDKRYCNMREVEKDGTCPGNTFCETTVPV